MSCYQHYAYERSNVDVLTSARWLRRNLSQQSSSASVADAVFDLDVVVERRSCLVSFSGGRQKVTWFPAAVDVVLVDADFAAAVNVGGLVVGGCCTGDHPVGHNSACIFARSWQNCRNDLVEYFNVLNISY